MAGPTDLDLPDNWGAGGEGRTGRWASPAQPITPNPDDQRSVRANDGGRLPRAADAVPHRGGRGGRSDAGHESSLEVDAHRRAGRPTTRSTPVAQGPGHDWQSSHDPNRNPPAINFAYDHGRPGLSLPAHHKSDPSASVIRPLRRTVSPVSQALPAHDLHTLWLSD